MGLNWCNKSQTPLVFQVEALEILLRQEGYTAWDPSSPAFVYGTTLCIPTIFVSYTGEALDNKAPLLRALNAVDEAATAVAKYFDKTVTKVNATLGLGARVFLD